MLNTRRKSWQPSGHQNAMAIAGLSLLFQVAIGAHLASGAAWSKGHAAQTEVDKQDTAPSSTLAVATIEDAVLTDAAHQKQLHLKISYPTQGNKFPLIVFSHGAGGSKDGYVPLIQHWTSHGYVCIQPTHADSLRLRKEQGEKLDGLLRPVDLEHGWIERIADMKLVLDSIDSLVKNNPELAGKIDKSKIGVGGHSFGALTCEIMCGAQVFDNKVDSKTIHDGRAKAVLLLSPAGVEDQPKLTADSWNQMKIPMMVMTGTNDKGRLGQDSSWRTQPYLYSPPGSKYLVFVNGGTHMIFSGNPDDAKKLRKLFLNAPAISNITGPDVSAKEYERMFAEVKLASLSFWDDFLKADKKAKAYLDNGGLAADSANIAKVEHR